MVSAVYRGDKAKPSVQTCTCVHRTCNRYGVTGDRYGVRQSHPRCDPCYTLPAVENIEMRGLHSSSLTRFSNGFPGFGRPSAGHRQSPSKAVDKQGHKDHTASPFIAESDIIY